ncbi:hypothetical protein ACFWYW_46670 [Nonomuraea sp. NPDC059023]|uniref:hypothetical protein n=1 Tax=unclassified Nonomuraea TaxID=2593643 RepID=UPI003694AFAE
MSTTEEPPSLIEKIMAQLIPSPASPAEQQAREELLNALELSLFDVKRGEFPDLPGILDRARGVLDALVANPDSLPQVLPHAKRRIDAFVDLPPIIVKATVYAPTVTIINDSGMAEDTILVTRETSLAETRKGLSRAQKRLLTQAEVFIYVWIALTAIGLMNYEQADVLITASGLNPWVAAMGASFMAGKAFDILYPADPDDE